MELDLDEAGEQSYDTIKKLDGSYVCAYFSVVMLIASRSDRSHFCVVSKSSSELMLIASCS